MPRRWIADLAWLEGDDLARDVLIEGSNGCFATIAANASANDAQRITGIVVPGLVNAHSHTFHRLLRGVTLDRLNQVGDQVITTLELHINLEPGVVDPVPTSHQAVVDNSEEQADKDNDENDPTHIVISRWLGRGSVQRILRAATAAFYRFGGGARLWTARCQSSGRVTVEVLPISAR